MLKRSVLFDTETTGVDPYKGDRIIEIAALELMNDLPTENFYHVLINPERDIPAEATKVHGFVWDDLKDKPKFREIVDNFLSFIGQDSLIAHNAPFDFKFVNAELEKLNREKLSLDRMIDTLQLARARFPSSPNSLDALCRRYLIDLSERKTHNALLDCKLLSEVYIELTGGRQRGLELAHHQIQKTSKTYAASSMRKPIYVVPTSEELENHRKFIKDCLIDPLWYKVT